MFPQLKSPPSVLFLRPQSHVWGSINLPLTIFRKVWDTFIWIWVLNVTRRSMCCMLDCLSTGPVADCGCLGGHAIMEGSKFPFACPWGRHLGPSHPLSLAGMRGVEWYFITSPWPIALLTTEAAIQTSVTLSPCKLFLSLTEVFVSASALFYGDGKLTATTGFEGRSCLSKYKVCF